MKYRPKGTSFIRSQCLHEGCSNLQYFKGYLKDSRYYGKYCNKHRKMKNVKYSYSLTNEKRNISNEVCSRCGWSGPCDRHRINNQLGYLPENVRVLCPNCHRLVTLELITL